TEACQSAVQAGPSSRIGQRSEQDAGGLIRDPDPGQASLPARFGADIRTPTRQIVPGRVAQRESTSLTSRGSQVRSLSRPPPSLCSCMECETLAIVSRSQRHVWQIL